MLAMKRYPMPLIHASFLWSEKEKISQSKNIKFLFPLIRKGIREPSKKEKEYQQRNSNLAAFFSHIVHWYLLYNVQISRIQPKGVNRSKSKTVNRKKKKCLVRVINIRWRTTKKASSNAIDEPLNEF